MRRARRLSVQRIIVVCVGAIAMGMLPLVEACTFKLADVRESATGGTGGGNPQGGNSQGGASTGGTAAGGNIEGGTPDGDASDSGKPAVDPKNILPNPSFENSTQYWTSKSGFLTVVADSIAPNGDYIARVSYDGTPTAVYYTIDNVPPSSLTYVAGTIYEASVYVRAHTVANPSAYLVLHFRENTQEIAQSAQFKPTSEFQRLSVQGLSSCGGAVDVHLSQYYPTAGDAFDVDLFQLVPIGTMAYSDAGCP